jgi:hypothetical protein
MRSANTVPAEEDLGFYYFTSNKTVQENFQDFEIKIVAYFKDWESCYTFENELIKENWGDPLMLNRHYQLSLSTFSMAGHSRPDLAEYNRKHKSKPKEIRQYKCSNCNKDIEKEEFCHHPQKQHYYCDTECRNQFVGRRITERKKKKSSNKIPKKSHVPWNKGKKCPRISEACKGRKAWNKGLLNPTAAENGRKSADKQSKTVTGRRIIVRNGNRVWAYPTDSDYPKRKGD